MMRYGEALDTLAQLEGVPEAEAAGWVSAKLDQPPNTNPNSKTPIPNPIPKTDTTNKYIPNLYRNTATLQHLQHCHTATRKCSLGEGSTHVLRPHPNR